MNIEITHKKKKEKMRSKLIGQFVIFLLSFALITGNISVFQFCHAQTDSEEQEQEEENYPFKAELKEDFVTVERYDGSLLMKTLEVDDMNRDSAFLTQDKEKLTIINYWAPWCAICMVELPVLRLFQKERPDIRVLYVAENRDGFFAAKDVIDEKELPYEDSFFDARNYIRRWLSIKIFPTSIIVSPDGKILYRVEGDGNWTSAYMQEFLNSLK
ncbi:MAG: TlpA family protein disulfide reductase [Alphaproteobacteria bacterium]|nr:TlpA family protein disulfide reductase [Alphaproteobacteria bacterium]MCB1551637.1 TlpA family protein disulfide reductase [Alphaproteobacteria bacterium]MCB9984754.1 TlpA family protein disulfide reductase [Micavibrio sp.]